MSKRKTIAIYLRISKDRNKDGRGSGLGVERQLADCRAYVKRAKLKGTIEVYSDNSRSGWDKKIVRPDWERMLADLRDGKIKAVVGWHADRWTRRPAQLEELWDAAQDQDAELHTVLGGAVQSMLALRIQGAISAEESDIKSNRQKAKQRQLAKAGLPHGGRRRFGYEPGMAAVRASEAAILKQLAERLLGGESLHSLAAWLTAEEIPTPQGGAWTGSNLGTLLRRPHLAAYRTHNGTLTEAVWPAALDRATWQLVQHKLGERGRKTNVEGNATKYLLSGIGRCLECDAPLRGRPLWNGSGRAYACATGRHCHRPVELVNARVETRVIARLRISTEAGEIAPADELSEEAELEAKLVGLEKLLKETTRMFAKKQIDKETLALTTGDIQDEREEIQLQLDGLRSKRRRPAAALKGMTGPSAAEAWEKAPLSRKRAIIALLFSVKLKGADHGRAPFRLEDVVIEPKEDAQAVA